MDNQQRRVFLFFVLVALWLVALNVIFKPPPRPVAPPPAAPTTLGADSPTTVTTPSIVAPGGTRPPRDVAAEPTPRPEAVELVRVETEDYRIELSPRGAAPVRWDLHGRGVVGQDNGDTMENGRERAIDLIDAELDTHGLRRPFEIVLAESGSVFYNELNTHSIYEVRRTEDVDAIEVEFTSPPTESGLRLIKTYRFPRRGMVSRLTLTLRNEGRYDLRFNNQGLGLGLALGPGLGVPPSEKPGFGSFASVTEIVRRTDRGIDAMRAKPNDPALIFVPDAGDDVRWAGLHNRYFMMGVIPREGFERGRPGQETRQGFGAAKARIDREIAEVGLASPDTLVQFPRLELYGDPFQLPPGESRRFAFDVFAGPKDRSTLLQVDSGIQGILFYDSFDWMRGLCILMMTLLNFFHGFLGNWGLAIVALVILVRIATFPLAQKGMRAQAKMMAEQAKIKPDMDKINAKYKDNPTKKQQEIMKLYREHNINPFGMLKGCVWLFIQLPIFFALYRLLSQSFDLRGASFLWIDDLSEPDKLFAFGFTLPLLGDHFNLLPILMAATQLLVSKLSMNPNAAGDPAQQAMQKQMMYMMPVLMMFMLFRFPSGLMLYWTISNVWQLFQQRFVNRKILGAATPAAGATAT